MSEKKEEGDTCTTHFYSTDSICFDHLDLWKVICVVYIYLCNGLLNPQLLLTIQVFYCSRLYNIGSERRGDESVKKVSALKNIHQCCVP